MKYLPSLLVMFLLVCLAQAAPKKPKPGTYTFIEQHTLEVATEYAGGSGINPEPVAWDKKTFQPGDTIKVDEFYWIEDAWAAKVVFHGVNLSVPMKKLKPTK